MSPGPCGGRAQSKLRSRGLDATAHVGGAAWQAAAGFAVSVPWYCFSARPCIVGEWSPWSGCAAQCKPMARVRRRLVQQEPRNGGAPCPALEERAGCLEYTTPQGQACGHAFGTEVCMGAAFPSVGPLKGQVLCRASCMRCREWEGPVCRE